MRKGRGLTGIGYSETVKGFDMKEYWFYWDRMNNSPRSHYYKTPCKYWVQSEVVIKALKKKLKSVNHKNIAIVSEFFKQYKEYKENETKE